MYELNEMIITTFDLSNYIAKSKLYEDYNVALDNALDLYKKSNTLEPITDDIVNDFGDIVLSVEMQELNRNYEIKQQLKQNVKIEITEDNLLDYFEEKPKTDIEVLQDKVAEYDNIIQDLLFNVLPSMINTNK